MAIIGRELLAAHLGILDTIDDIALEAAATAASNQIAAWCDNGGFDKTTVGSETARVFQPISPYVCVVDDFHDTTNLVVKTDDDDTGTYEVTWTVTTDFVLEPTNGRKHGQTWPYYRIVAVGDRLFPTDTRRPGVQVTAAWGWASYPTPIQQAALIQAARLFKRRHSPEGIVGGFDQFGAVRVSSRPDPDVEQLIAPYRRATILGVL